METKKTKSKKKSPVVQENIVNNSMFSQSDITHGSWNYSQSTESTVKNEIKIKHETLNLSM